ncbi:MAG: hypothetical protein HOV79_11200 [Hamadaea sp.]|nr:hypothetical protein [Hamadaea sp.]
MKTRALLTAVAVTAFLLSGCSGKNDDPVVPSSAISPSPILDGMAAAALVEAAQKSLSTSSRLSATIEVGESQKMTIAGAIDPQGKRLQLVMTDLSGAKTEIRMIGDDVYMGGLPQLQGKWVKLDASKVAGLSGTLASTQQQFAILGGIVELTAGPGGVFTGVADPKLAYDRAPAGQQKDSLAALVKNGGDNARIPFKVTLKDGYLTAMTMEIKMEVSAKVTQAKADYVMSDFGKPVTVTPPAAKDIVQQ